MIAAGRARRVASVALALLVCGCADLLPRDRKAAVYAAAAGWSYRLIDTGMFPVASAVSPPLAGSGQLAVYIEGDGLAFLDRATVSADPTPTEPTALRLAIAAPQRPAAYLARPCQYIMAERPPSCTPAVWTSRRYAPEIVETLGRAIDSLKRDAGVERVVLVGYSGGGALAVLLAARRTDVAGIVTIGANLDLGYWVRRDGLAPLVGSLDPAGVADRLVDLPQVHFVGSRDDVTGPDIVRAYLSRLGPSTHATLVEIDGFDHACCWVDAWPTLIWRPELGWIPGWRAPTLPVLGHAAQSSMSRR